ncbi:dnaJ homolog subfamily B member 9 [Nephila pilipes]|uniref:DnaJ homolog subfamily B member 9 n=1 Tax=Nephila pilipes TaxID=299642 RepID=A0A8X6QFI6_NEPPI|nr:dnaJ homolog subfamily B member 9 [Nephila pilipes]
MLDLKITLESSETPRHLTSETQLMLFLKRLEEEFGLSKEGSTLIKNIIAVRLSSKQSRVDKKASNRDIKKAFRKLAMQYHPDKNKDPNAEKKFREIAEAYEVLSDEQKRREYDQVGRSSFRNGGGGFNFNYHEFFNSFDSFTSRSRGNRRKGGFGSFSSSHFFNFDDLFDDFETEEGFGGFFGDMFGSQDSFFGSHFGDGDINKVRTEQKVFSSSGGGRCRTVTQRVGNMVTTYTQCS